VLLFLHNICGENLTAEGSGRKQQKAVYQVLCWFFRFCTHKA